MLGSVFRLAAVLGLVALGYWAGQRRAPEPSPSEQATLAPTPAVLQAVRRLARLESVQFRLERVIDLKREQKRWLGLVQAKDAILLIASGEVTAGVDLSNLEEDAIRVDWPNKRAIVRLPPVDILHSGLDEQRTYVHSRTTDTLFEERTSLETEARRRAEQSLRQAALDGGILKVAETSAVTTVTSLLRSLGFVDVQVFLAPAAPRE